MKKIELIIEWNDGMYWGRIEEKSDYSPNGAGETVEELIGNIKESIEDYVTHEGKNDKLWNKTELAKVEFELKYDLHAFFETFTDIKLTAIAERADINRSLLNQYATGKKHPSIETVKRIESVIHELGTELQKVALVA